MVHKLYATYRNNNKICIYTAPPLHYIANCCTHILPPQRASRQGCLAL